MRNEFLPFTRPAINEADIRAVTEVLRSGWITNGPQNAALESGVCEITGNRFGVALSSATAAMHLLMKIMKLGPGDEVITPSMTWVSIVNMIVLAGATPVFCEIDRETMLATPESIAEKITPRTKLIIPVHFAGAALDLDGIYRVAGEIPVVEDAAHALGTYYKGRHIGSTGAAIYSFHAIKNVTTGEGGMFTTDDPQLAGKVRSLKFHGLGVDAYDRQTHGRAPQAQVVEPGFKFNMPDMQAVLGVRQLARIAEFNAKREALALRYREKFASIDEILPLKDPDYNMKHSWHLFVVRVTDKAGLTRDEFMSELKKRNIGTGLHFRCTHLQKYYRDALGYKTGMYPNTEWNSERICSIPLFPDMTEKDQDDVIEAVKDILAKR